jgi:outer membrane protein
MQRLTTSAAAAALILAMAGSAVAAPKPAAGPVATQAAAPRAAAAAPAAPPINHGPAIPNVCIYADERAVGTSLVGKAASTRMQQLRAQVTAELQAENTALQTDASALNAKKASLPADQLQAQGQALQARADALNAKANQRQRELEQTGAEALGQIHQRIDGILRNVYQQRGCSILLNGDSVYLANPAMDVTQTVVTQLDAAMPTISFDRKVLPAQPQQ